MHIQGKTRDPGVLLNHDEHQAVSEYRILITTLYTVMEFSSNSSLYL